MSQNPDSSFFTLLFSMVFHAALIALVVLLPTPKPNFSSSPTEVEYIDRSKKDIQALAPDAPKEELFERLKHQADYLARVAQRVKKETIARQDRQTNNNVSLENLRPEMRPQASRIGGRARERGDIGAEKAGDGKEARASALPPATLNQYIPGIENGYFTALNADTFTYYAFFSRMYEQIANRWTPAVRAYSANLNEEKRAALSTQNRTTRTEYVLSKAGDLLKIRVSSSSGFTDLDVLGVDAIKMAAPFLNPPRELVDTDGFIHLSFAFTLYFRPSFGPASQ